MSLFNARLAGILLLGSVLSVSSGVAGTIFVNNFSFETLPAAGLPNGCGVGCFFTVDAIPGWSNGGSSGQFQPGTQAGNFTYFNTLSDGITNAFDNGGTISQTVGSTVQTGVVYTLMVDIGCRNDQPCLGTADLLVNGVQYAAVGVLPAPGNWATFTATYTGLPGDLGDAITIELNSTGSQGNFDNVQLADDTTTSATPEPSFSGILGLGLIGLMAMSRRLVGRQA
jgi:hypothetical protein